MRCKSLLRLAVAGISMSLLLALSACVQTYARNAPMNKNGWTTHCFGRFLIDLPPDARLGVGYRIWGEKIERESLDAESIKSRLDTREQELKGQEHRTQGNMFVRRTGFDGASAGIVYWSSAHSMEMMHSEAYLAVSNSPDSPVFSYGGGVAPEKLESAIAFDESLSRKIRSRGRNEIPVEPGFCLDGGYIAGSEYMSEGFRAGITLLDHPGMHMTFRSSTGAAETGLLDRVGGFFRTEVLGTVVGMKTLRKGRRSAGSIAGEEYLVAGGDRQQRVYAFRWELQGRDDSLAEPNLSLEMGVLERDPDDDGNPPPPAFESDEQALQLWDTILESIRLRPGAV